MGKWRSFRSSEVRLGVTAAGSRVSCSGRLVSGELQSVCCQCLWHNLATFLAVGSPATLLLLAGLPSVSILVNWPCPARPTAGHSRGQVDRSPAFALIGGDLSSGLKERCSLQPMGP